MAEYINRDAVLADELTYCLPYSVGKAAGKVVVFAEDIEAIPAADVAPVVHGRWIKTTHENACAEWTDFTCSVCGAVFDDNEWLFSEWSGCPVCLARMDGAE